MIAMRPPLNEGEIKIPLFTQSYEIAGGNFIDAGNASTRLKDLLKELEISHDIIRRTVICTYEAEMNVVMYARRGRMTLEIFADELVIHVADEGPGIPNIELAMREGYSTATEAMRERGFGAGMGLPNIKKNATDLHISSIVGQGTDLRIAIAMA